MDLDPLPSASGEVAAQLFLEEPSRDEAETETESRDEDSRHETESRDEEEVEEQALPKKKKTRGEAGVPDIEPANHEAKALIVPDGIE